MMIIRWLAQACVVVRETANNKQQATLIMDPYSPDIGLRLPKLEAQVVTISHAHRDHNNAAAIEGSPFIITEAGEYEVGGLAIRTISSFHDAQSGAERGSNLIIRVDTMDFSFAHFGDFGQTELRPDQMDALSDVDMIFIPVGGTYTIGGSEAAKLVTQLEPGIVVPIHYHIPGLTVKNLAAPEPFFQAMGQKPTIIEGDWKVKTTDFPSEGTRVVQLMPQAKS